METIDSVEKSLVLGLRSGGGREGGGESGAGCTKGDKRGIAQRKTRGESSKGIRTTMLDIHFDTTTLSYSALVFSNYRARKFRTKMFDRFPANAAKFRNGRTRKTEVPRP